MVDRLQAARDAQQDAKQQFQTAMEQFRSVVNFKGGNLEREYEKLNATLQRCESRAEAVHTRIGAVEDVSNALFKEWRSEIKAYSSDAMRRSSQNNYDTAQAKYKSLMVAMRKAASRLEPALVPLRDQVMFMKHNLNARAIAGLSSELSTVESNVEKLVREIETAVAQADGLIATLKPE